MPDTIAVAKLVPLLVVVPPAAEATKMSAPGARIPWVS